MPLFIFQESFYEYLLEVQQGLISFLLGSLCQTLYE